MQQGSLNIGSIGQKLEAARRAKGVTVSEAGQATKIMSKYIESMEADDFGALSAPVYVKGFIRMYAQYLGLESETLVNEYLSQHAPKRKAQLGDDVRKKLVQVDQVPGESNGGATAVAPPRARKNIFGTASDAVGSLHGVGLPFKKILMSAGALVLLLIVVSTVKQCGQEEEPEPEAVGGAAMEHQMIQDAVPDVYISSAGE